MSIQIEFLKRAWCTARSGGHIFPEYAACEAALESGWGGSKLAEEAHNLFGQKQSDPPLPGTGTIAMPTREYLHGHWMTVQANWTHFYCLTDCFAARMELLKRLSGTFPHYRAALKASTGEEYILAVSKSWSTDPDRAGKVLAIYDAHSAELLSAIQAATGQRIRVPQITPVAPLGLEQAHP